MNNIFISIVIPIFNVKYYLEECLQSIVGQAVQCQCEVILIDDGSNDGSGILCDKYAKKYPDTIRIYHNENHGLLFSRQFGLQKARGDYILNCDSDDCMADGAIEIIYKTLKANLEADVLIYNLNSYCEGKVDKLTSNIFSKSEETFKVEKKIVHEEFLKSTRIVSMCCKVYRRDIKEINNFLNYEKIGNGEDTLQSIPIYLNAENFLYLNKGLYNYRTQIGMTSRFDKNYFNNFSVAINLIATHMNDWKGKDVQYLIARKIYYTLGRTISQLKYEKKYLECEKINYLSELRDKELVQNYSKYYKEIRKYLPSKYRILDDLFLVRRFRMIVILLCIRNYL